MVPELARQSVIIKANREHTTILGNYECAYAIGVLSRVSGISVQADATDFMGLYEPFLEAIASYTPANDQERRVIDNLQNYKPMSNYDADMKLLLQMGIEEERLWKI